MTGGYKKSCNCEFVRIMEQEDALPLPPPGRMRRGVAADTPKGIDKRSLAAYIPIISNSYA